ncbi:glycoside hydrolase family 16 protein [Cellulophaga baltica]|uniref:glycoside hydrolase family 16 protein n=1 Tax=Cellulophaga TaxID=104264 RepID=UPI001C07D622|nr:MULTISPECIES: glycoside hydrolase family 16 protein [Cellulophaga]MBU2996934.1 glycoside hydrolase family 16 protein [Cellulophaga baltica]MDO6768332.1 glycoside hydrolase family 16 protein [Cellulophaga sp. 1_MG-2023]
MKNIKYYIGSLLVLAMFFASCHEDELVLGETVTPSNLSVTAEIVGVDDDNPYGDGSGAVNFTAVADDALSYKYIYDGQETVESSGELTLNFSTTGVNVYSITVLAIGEGGLSSSTTIDVEVLALYEAPDDLLQMLVGDGSVTWRIKAEAASHFGLGPVDGEVQAEWYAAAAYEKDGVGMYDDRYIFNTDGTYTHITNGLNDDPTEDTSGTIFGRTVLVDELQGTGEGTENGSDVENYPYDDFIGEWSLTAPNDQETLTLSGTGFLGYYIGGNHSYKIFSRSDTEMVVSSTDGNSEFDWWFTLTSEEETDEEATEEFVSEFNTLYWSEEFEVDGAPATAFWTYDLGDGGWGNNEVQTYTDDETNVIVEDGVLKITALADGSGGYTSARLKTQDLFDFKYGRVEVSAKLPSAQGTWPAIWMLGSDFETVGWPLCGEIDIMEQTGDDKNTSLGTFHWSNDGATASYGESLAVENASSEFHLYTLEWTEDKLTILLDNVTVVTMDNNSELPFYDKEFFMILNIAMGGTLGGDIDPDFTEDSMEIDYIRIYQ